MSTSAPTPAPTAPAPATDPGADARRLRLRALGAGLALVPATVVAVFLALATDKGGHCVMRGTCGDVPGWLYQAALAVAGAAWLVALTTPGGRPPAPVRRAALRTLLGAEAVFLLLVLAHYLG
ncbi:MULTISPECIES: hypothetical protein [unclassified Streptomyces]|uniref:hypothetical protein n=1 Tax=unclassified Streptomyces TaxID=2593676 RepID=UPI0004C3D64E